MKSRFKKKGVGQQQDMAPHCTAVASVPSGQRSKPRVFHCATEIFLDILSSQGEMYAIWWKFISICILYECIDVNLYRFAKKKPEESWPHQLFHSMPRWSAWMFIIPTGNLCEKTEKFIPPAVCETFFWYRQHLQSAWEASRCPATFIYVYIYISQYIYIYIYNVYITTISVIYVSCPASPALNRHMTVAFANVASWDSQAAIHRHFCANARRSAGHDSSRDGWGWGSKSCDRLDESPSCFYVSSQNMYSLCYIYLSARLHNSTITHANASCYTIHACILEASKGVIQCMTMILRSSCGIS